jgi:hypothetical protein
MDSAVRRGRPDLQLAVVLDLAPYHANIHPFRFEGAWRALRKRSSRCLSTAVALRLTSNFQRSWSFSFLTSQNFPALRKVTACWLSTSRQSLLLEYFLQHQLPSLPVHWGLVGIYGAASPVGRMIHKPLFMSLAKITLSDSRIATPHTSGRLSQRNGDAEGAPGGTN